MDGFINVLKPPGMTSHDVVHWLRKNLDQKKIGHTGTLDPGACGCLIIAVGKATKLSEYVLELPKTYRCEMELGWATDSGDTFGRVLEMRKVPPLSEQDILTAFSKFTGNIRQVPPMTSAIKVNGKKLYEMAREGKTISREARPITIEALTLVSENLKLTKPKIVFDVICSKGTYIRSLCHDLGQELGCGAVMRFLIRSGVGPFKLKDTQILEEIENCNSKEYLLPMDTPIITWPKALLKDLFYAKKLAHGNLIEPSGFIINGNLTKDSMSRIRVYDHLNNFVAIGNLKYTENGGLQPRKVFWPIEK